MIADSSTSLDRAADLRVEPGILDRLRADETTRVIAVRDGRVRIAGADLDPAALLRVPASEIVDATWALLGRDDDGTAVLLAVLPPEGDTVDTAPDEVWLGLRDLGARLGPGDTELLIEALALGGWLRDALFCPRCGGETEVRQAGWSRRCLVCGREHFPRTDPAVIVAVESSDGERLLLGANANWGGRMYSCFAGFTEAGESLESTVHRELEEESGVRLASLRYVSSQPWPFPRSLMLGFRAVALDDHVLRPDGEEIIDVRWFSRDEIGSALAGDGPVGLPGPASIARALILEWFEERA
ncbi:NAD(+) diphosphatase [Microbacterium sp. WCS2018Hpa-9]|uniref:NAD(+) diphosphatase n=1 Tax=Microbacterium sp. WCS2018Hpa-9 TaxID=3073635 RepID=UPI002889DDEC|nr:NAD(+) diphosphatase [Microbacterium sp. WCS2018Hpa-9]